MSNGTGGAAGLSPDQMRAAIAQLSSPDTVDSPFGRLDFFDGVPTPDTVSRAYDALDLMRGIEVFLNAVPGASLVAMRRGLRSAGVTSARVIGITEPRANSQSLFLTPNTETTYGTTFLDLKAWGPTVIEAPPQSLCVVDDFWFRYVADMGIAGPDKGAGGKYLFVPPGYDGDLPDGYFTYPEPHVLQLGRPARPWRRPRHETDPDLPPLGGIRTGDNVFINLAEKVMNTVHSNDFSFFEELDELIQEEPPEALDAERAGQLAAIGLVNGQPFAPDERMRGILSQAAQIGAGLARTVAYAPRDPDAALYGSWKNAFVGGSYEFLRNGARLLDARTQFHYLATVITPAMAHAQVGAGSAYAYTVQDSNGDLLDGGRTYRLHVDANPPAKNFWAVDVYDTQTRSLLQVPSTIWPALASNSGTLQPNDDGSFDLYFGPTRPRGERVELGRDHPRQVLVSAVQDLRPARTVVRPDLETQRVRTHHLNLRSRGRISASLVVAGAMLGVSSVFSGTRLREHRTGPLTT